MVRLRDAFLAKDRGRHRHVGDDPESRQHQHDGACDPHPNAQRGCRRCSKNLVDFQAVPNLQNPNGSGILIDVKVTVAQLQSTGLWNQGLWVQSPNRTVTCYLVEGLLHKITRNRGDRWALNPQPLVPQASALPIELRSPYLHLLVYHCRLDSASSAPPGNQLEFFYHLLHPLRIRVRVACWSSC